MAEVRRVDIGFKGGQVLPARVEEDALEALQRALADPSSDRWHELTTHDSEVALDLAQVVYVRVDLEAHRVGF
jgi:hypothetical protein